MTQTIFTRLKLPRKSTIQVTVPLTFAEPLDVISARFHNTVVDAIVETCRDFAQVAA